MTDAAVIAVTEYLIDKLGQIATIHTEASGEVEQLTADLNYLNSFLKCCTKIKDDDDRLKELLSHVGEAVHHAEDLVDAFFAQTQTLRVKGWLSKFFRESIRLEGIARQVYKVRQQLEALYGEKMLLDGDDLEALFPFFNKRGKTEKSSLVGLDKPTSDIIGCLREDTPQLDIISIVGMPGIGKSTLAGKILRDPIIQHEFPTRIWVYVSKLTPKDVFLSLLSEFTSITEEMRHMEENELAALVNARLEKGKFLIVMDNVWTPEDWSKVSVALPTANRLIKIIITSRFKDVATSARPAYEMKLLEDGHSEQLLQYVVCGVPKWEPPEIEADGRLIARECKGLPLAIVLMGGILSRKIASANVTTWEKFSQRVREYRVEDPKKVVDGVISLSYQELPYHLKPFFLYFGMFPEDFEIPTWKLFRMWIAEGFIRDKNSGTSESYLDELISRNLVSAGKTSRDGKIKTCRIHDSLWEFCKKQAGKDNENFLEEITDSRVGDANYRRLCIHSNISEFLASKPHGRRVRSLVCFTKEDHTLAPEHISAIPRGFKLLRVLDAKTVKFKKIPPDMYELLHLRYIHLSFLSRILPRAFSKLRNVQTLVVETPERTLEIKADIWKMRHLTSMKTNAITMLPQPDNDSAQDEHNIQTLGTISPESCTDIVLGKAWNLKKVSIRGDLSILLTSSSRTGGVSFDYMAKLSKLEELKLHNDIFPRRPSDRKMSYLPPSHAFPPNLKILTLSGTYLDWSQMKVLASLDNLEVLKLKEMAFIGNYWEVVDGGFNHLRVLFVGRTDLVIWKMSAGNFPNLTHLELHNCQQLREVPIELAQIPSLDVLIVNHCKSAAASAEKIREAKGGDKAK